VDIGGWSSGTQVTVSLDSASAPVLGSAPVNKPRPDVVQTLGRPDLANSGFDVSWYVWNVSNGNHVLYVTASGNGQSTTQQVQVSVSGQGAGANNGYSFGFQGGYGYPNYGYGNPNYGYSYPNYGSYGTPYNSFYPSYPSGTICNPFFPAQSTLFPYEVPCNGGTNGYYPYSNIYSPYTSPYYGYGIGYPYYGYGIGYPYYGYGIGACGIYSYIACMPAPTNATAMSPAPGVVTVSWAWPTATAGTTFTVTGMSTTAGAATPAPQTVTYPTTTVNFTGLTHGAVYTFTITANGPGGTSAPATTAPVTP
jgi:hypothetical protein